VRRLAKLLLRAFGFRLVGEPPPVPRCVIVFAPHTSNWDFPILLLVKFGYGVDVSYLGKHTLFRWPFGWFFRAVGGIPVERHKRASMVKQIAAEFARRQRLWLAMSPEGTRSKTDHWKSGFYRIALAANVPVVLVFLDTIRRECGVGAVLELTGDAERDIERFREFYATKRGIRPELTSEIRFKPRRPV
jgi:1-acyl-sn-glycerol-3-phosphate acyltransferase